MVAFLLLRGHTAGATVGWRDGRAVAVEQFIAAARALQRRLPVGAHCVNLCQDRLNFALGFAAALIGGNISVLPPSRTPGALRDIEARFGRCCVLADSAGDGADVAAADVSFDDAADASTSMPAIDGAQTAFVAFTAGSTGTPSAHAKSWQALVQGAAALRERVPMTPGSAVVGTVPPQHMWGIEATVMLPLQSGGALHSGSPLLPADIAACLTAVDAPRWLVTTPLHIRSCVLGLVALPPLAGVATATAPLDATVAASFEEQSRATVIEIYGSTETGAIATRRTATGEAFRALSGLRLRSLAGKAVVDGGHVGLQVALNDRIVVRGDREFTLAGRSADIVKIGGKRTSLAALNFELNRIPGVLDGAYCHRDDAGPVGRLMAFVVAPGLARGAIIDALRERVDPVFLPRPLVIVDALPRTAVGKLPEQAMAQLRTAAIRQAAEDDR